MMRGPASKAAPMRRRLFLLGLLGCAAFSAGAQAQDVRRFDLALKAGALPKEQRTIQVKQGEAVELRWTSDQPIRLHLHGYDVEIAVKPGEPTVTALNARIAGRFSVDKLQDKPGGHQHGGKVLYFEVHP
jgi:ferric-dicitrate binding protein FerR (iron transport regulator)